MSKYENRHKRKRRNNHRPNNGIHHSKYLRSYLDSNDDLEKRTTPNDYLLELLQGGKENYHSQYVVTLVGSLEDRVKRGEVVELNGVYVKTSKFPRKQKSNREVPRIVSTSYDQMTNYKQRRPSYVTAAHGRLTNFKRKRR